ncbi:hypothetical protein H4R35_007264 [Dimargaris xerosporica]|nr:hypothetical protein H4R35_007264 [Dimargaris xerosporica]
MVDGPGNSPLPVVTTQPHTSAALCPVPPASTEGMNSTLTPTPMATSQPSSPGLSGPPTTGDMMDTSEPSTPQIPIHLTATPETAAQMHSPSLGGTRMASSTRPKHLQSGCPTPGSPLAGQPLVPTAQGTKPRVLVIRTASLPQNLHVGVKEVCTHAPYSNVLLDNAIDLEQLITDRDVWYLR